MQILKILQKCPNEQNKFIAIGIGVLNTAILSMFTMGYAIYNVLNSEKLTFLNFFGIILFSVIWGFIIFGIDWGLISTIHKKKYYDIKSGLYLAFTTLFRLAVAAVISFTVSKPLEVLVFKDYLPTARRGMKLDYKDKLNSGLNQKIAELNGVVDSLLLDMEQWKLYKETRYKEDELYSNINDDLKNLEIQVEGIENKKESLRTRRNEAQARINSFQSRINQAKNIENAEERENELSSLLEERSPFIEKRDFENKQIRSLDQNVRRLENLISLKDDDLDARRKVIGGDNEDITNKKEETLEFYVLQRDKALEQGGIEGAETSKAANVFDKDNLINNLISIGYLEKWKTSDNKGEQEIARKVIFVRYLLMILILIIDIAPIVIKLLIKRGEYEEIKESIEQKTYLEESTLKRKLVIKSKADQAAFEAFYQQRSNASYFQGEKLNDMDELSSSYFEYVSKVDKFNRHAEFENNNVVSGLKTKDQSFIIEIKEKLESNMKLTLKKMGLLFRDYIEKFSSK